MWGMSGRPLPAARRFETFVRWSTYSAVALPVATFLGSALVVQGPIGSGVAVQAGVFGLALALTAGNVLVSRRSIDTVVGRAGRLPVGLLAGWALVLISSVLWACWSNAWLLRVLLELQAAHEDRAALTVAEERLRISRDLHDVLGRTLTTIAVKSSLAAELVDRGGAERAAQEIAGIRRIAEEAGNEMRRVVRGEHRTTWDDEVTGARSLLESAGIRCAVTGDPVPAGCAEALAWVVREAVTNVLRHSAATQVTLATTHEDGEVLLTVTNDGVTNDRVTGGQCAAGAGSGLNSLSKRISALGGHVTTLSCSYVKPRPAGRRWRWSWWVVGG
jgi:two-component system, NarL family, sensor histidine kinase DesK